MKNKENKYDSANLVRLGSESRELDSTVKKIVNLYNGIKENFEDTFEKAKKIGEILSQEKEKIEHGKFTEWVENNLPFGIRQAQKYMKIHENKQTIEESKSELEFAFQSVNGIVKSISKPKEKEINPEPTKEPSKKTKIQMLLDEIAELERELKAKKVELNRLTGKQ